MFLFTLEQCIPCTYRLWMDEMDVLEGKTRGEREGIERKRGGTDRERIREEEE